MVAARNIRIGVGYAPVRAQVNPAASALTDNFDDNSIDPAKWVSAGFYEAETTGGTVSEANQRLEITPPVSSVRAGGYVSANSIDLTNDSVAVKISNTATFSPDQAAYLAFGPNNNSYYMFIVWPGGPNNLIGRRRVNGSNTDLFNITYSATTHAWFRIRHQASDNTIHFETATSSASDPPLSGDWTDRGSETFTSSFAVNNGSAAIGSTTFGSDPSPGTAYLDGFNTATTAAVSNDISGTSSLTFSSTATVTGLGTLGGSSALTFADSGTLTGLGSVVGSSSLVLSPSGTATGLAALLGTSALTFAPSATATGLGRLIGSSTLVLAPSGTATGLGSLLGSSPLTFTPAGTVRGLGALAGTDPLTLAGSGTLTGIGSLLASTALSFSLSGTVAAAGSNAIAGTTALVFASAATLTGLGQVAASTSFSLTISGHLVAGALGHIKVWSGAANVAKPVKTWNGVTWVTKPLKYWTGTTWRATSY